MSFFFFNDTATTEIYTLSLHDALPICVAVLLEAADRELGAELRDVGEVQRHADRKSTRLNSSHTVISYAVFCLKKKERKLEVWGDGSLFFDQIAAGVPVTEIKINVSAA